MGLTPTEHTSLGWTHRAERELGLLPRLEVESEQLVVTADTLEVQNALSVWRENWRVIRELILGQIRDLLGVQMKSQVSTRDRPSKRGTISLNVVNVAWVTSSACWGSRPAPRAAWRFWAR